jgi:flavin-binding protein dodecin
VRLSWITRTVGGEILHLQNVSEEDAMPDSVYKVIELVGTSTESWEKAAKAAVDMAAKSLRDLRIAEIEKLDVQLKDGKVEAYRVKMKVSFKFEGKA